MLKIIQQKRISNNSKYNRNSNNYSAVNTMTKPYDNDVFIKSKSKKNIGLAFGSKSLFEKLGEIHRHYGRLINQDPHNSALFFERSKIHAEHGFFAEALEDASKAVSLDPHNYFMQYHKGAINLQLGNNKDAIQDFTNAIHLNKGDLPSCYLFRGCACQNLDKHELAIKDFDRALNAPNEKHKNRAYIHNKRGLSNEALGNVQQAFDDYSSSIKHNPNLAEAYYNRGALCLKIGEEIPLAVEDTIKAHQLDPSNSNYQRQMRVITVGLMDKNEEKLGFYKTLIEKNPLNHELYSEKAIIHRLMGDHKSAKECDEKAKMYEEGNAVFEKVSFLNGLLGQFEE